MEFGSLGLPAQSTTNQTGASGPAQSATLDTNPENTVTPVDSGGASQNDRRQDLLGQDQSGARGDSEERSPDDLQLTSRRTTLNFDSEQNRIFLEVVDSNTEEVIERIPSDQLVELVQQVLGSESEVETETAEEASTTVQPAPDA
ncbi:MAG: flagellar protein FlaG [Rhodospirillaceae bacterium]|nr:flagellar protein FlaG [Rhodospirillaceae bacterium]